MAAYQGKKLAQMTSTERAARIKALIASHNTSAIPDKYLPAKQAGQRNLNARLDAPVVPGSGLSNRDLAHEATAATQLQYGPAQQALNTQIGSNLNQPRVTGGYYDQWRQILADAA